MTIKFDPDDIIKGLRAGKPLSGESGVLTPLIKQLLEAALNAELSEHLSSTENESNRRNGYTKKTIKTGSGAFELETPRDRAGEFEPKIVKKHQTKLTDEIDGKILSLFSLGMSYRDIKKHVQEMYGLEVSEATISAVTDSILPELKAWQCRALDAIYPIIWLDAIHYKVKEAGHYVSKAIYTVLGLNGEGHKELLGLYLSESEGATYWMTVLTDLQNRGVKDILIACVDGLNGFPEAIKSIFPKTEVQLCIVHQVRNSAKYIASKDQKEFIRDLKRVYQADTIVGAEIELDKLEEKWGNRYQAVIDSWRKKWPLLSAYFRYPKIIRKPIYTTNTVEAVHRQFRKLTKSKGAFPNETSLLKLLYVGIQKSSEKWTMPIPNWGETLLQLNLFFPDRLDSLITI